MAETPGSCLCFSGEPWFLQHQDRVSMKMSPLSRAKSGLRCGMGVLGQTFGVSMGWVYVTLISINFPT